MDTLIWILVVFQVLVASMAVTVALGTCISGNEAPTKTDLAYGCVVTGCCLFGLSVGL